MALEIFQVARIGDVWDISNMFHQAKRDAAAAGARIIYDKLMERRPASLSNNEWAARAGVNSSFFTALRKGSEPSVGNLRRILQAIDISLSEFFLDEAAGKVGPLIGREELEAVLCAALPGMPRNSERRASYLAEVVLSVAALPQNNFATLSSEDVSNEAAQEQEHEAQFATNQVGRR